MTVRKVFIVEMTAGSIWKSPEHRESSRLNMSSRLDLTMREAGARREKEKEVESKR